MSGQNQRHDKFRRRAVFLRIRKSQTERKLSDLLSRQTDSRQRKYGSKNPDHRQTIVRMIEQDRKRV